MAGKIVYVHLVLQQRK